MALLQVRNFPDHIYNELTLLAQKEHRSVAQQALVLIESALDEPEQQKKSRMKLLQNLIRSEPEIPGDFPNPADLIREDRER